MIKNGLMDLYNAFWIQIPYSGGKTKNDQIKIKTNLNYRYNERLRIRNTNN